MLPTNFWPCGKGPEICFPDCQSAWHNHYWLSTMPVYIFIFVYLRWRLFFLLFAFILLIAHTSNTLFFNDTTTLQSKTAFLNTFFLFHYSGHNGCRDLDHLDNCTGIIKNTMFSEYFNSCPKPFDDHLFFQFSKCKIHDTNHYIRVEALCMEKTV